MTSYVTNVASLLTNITSSLTNFTSSMTNMTSSLTNITPSLINITSSLTNVTLSLINISSSLLHGSNDSEKSNMPRTDFYAHKPKLMFLKTHKSATSTLVNMFYLYGIRRKLNFVMKPYDHWLGEISQTIRVKDLLQPRPGGCWDMQVTHGIFNAEGEHEVLPKDKTFYTTIVRSPDTQLSSAFYYFGEEKRQRLRWGSGLSKSELISKYLENSWISPTDHLSPAMDLGWRHYSSSKYGSGTSVEEKIEGFIQFLDKEMDLVMVSERMDESLIVLKERMAWTLEDIMYLNRNVAPDESKSDLTESTRQKIFEHLTLDKKMYDHFNATLDEHIDELGRERILGQVREFQRVRQELEDKCFDKNKVKVMEWDTRSYELTEYGKKDNLACTFLQLNDLELDDAISQLQNSRDYTEPIRYKERLVKSDYLFQDIITRLQQDFARNVSGRVKKEAVEFNILRFR